MKYLNWETGNLPRHVRMSHRLRSMRKAAIRMKAQQSQQKGTRHVR